VHETSTYNDLIRYKHVACFSPVKSIWTKSIENGHFATWPGLTEKAVEEYLDKETAMVMGNINQQGMNTRSTQPKNEPVCDFERRPPIEDDIKPLLFMH
jgi:hypothetical protein